jgi:IS30 family transposase
VRDSPRRGGVALVLPDVRGVSTVRFSNAQVAEAVQPFWAALQRGEFISDTTAQAGTYRKQGTRWVAACGGVRPRRGRNLKGRCLSFAEREEIALGRARGETIRVIAGRLGRGAVDDHARAEAQRRLPRLAGDERARAGVPARESPQAGQAGDQLTLRAIVQDDLQKRYSLEQIPGRLRLRFPRNPEMWVSIETIYPVALRAVARRAAPRTDPRPAHRAGAAQADLAG